MADLLNNQVRHRRRFQNSARAARRKGFTLVEIVMSTFIVVVVLVGSLKLVASSLQARISQARLNEGSLLTRDLMAEIVHTRYEEPDDPPEFGRESGENGGSREDWDDLDDYDDWSSSPPELKDGSTLPNYIDWTREVEVRYVSLNSTNGVGSMVDDDGLKRVIVTVTDPQGHQTTRAMVRSRFGSYELDQPPGTTVITQVEIGLQMTSNSAARSRSTASILDHAAAN